MRLWNEYEGTTIAGIFPVDKLIRPEGRSAFFSTINGTGIPAVLRLIEAINDEAEILTRWKAVSELNEAHLITLKKFGQTTFENTPLIYVLMESSDADLAGILQERPLTADETREIAVSLVDAVEALHAADFVHEHIEPSNVMATSGDIVKLRSDCVREAPEGEEGIALKKQDVHDLAVVLLQALTQRKTLGTARLPAPFDPIIRNGMDGTWGLAQISAALTPPVAPVTFERAPVHSSQAPSTQPLQMPLAMPSSTDAAVAARMARPQAAGASLAAAPAVAPHQARINLPLESEDPTRRRLWMAIAPVVIVVAAALGWHALHKPASTEPASQPVTTLAEVGKPAEVTPSTPSAPVAVAPSPADVPAADALHPWRVVAYTYNRRDQAQHKADTIAQRDAALRPEVFSPSANGPFLVTLGGAMTRGEAAAFRQKAQNEGLPRDIYIQNYESREQRHARRHR